MMHARPLLVESKKDWCHDRVFFEVPPWWLEMEKHLPMRNRTITFSYLLMKKEKPVLEKKNLGRLVGDSLVEKRKTRQMVCRGFKREFLSWLHKETERLDLPRGEIVSVEEYAATRGGRKSVSGSGLCLALNRLAWQRSRPIKRY